MWFSLIRLGLPIFYILSIMGKNWYNPIIKRWIRVITNSYISLLKLVTAGYDCNSELRNPIFCARLMPTFSLFLWTKNGHPSLSGALINFLLSWNVISKKKIMAEFLLWCKMLLVNLWLNLLVFYLKFLNIPAEFYDLMSE